MLLLWLSFSVVGARIAALVGKPNGTPELYPLFGWGFAILLMVPLGMLAPLGVQLAMLVMTVLTCLLLLRKKAVFKEALSWPFLMGLLLLSPLLLAMAGFQPRAWDDFSHWIPNAFYLFTHGNFPGKDSVDVFSYWPGYPYALALITASISWIAGNFVESGGPLLNSMLLILFAATLTRLIRTRSQQATLTEKSPDKPSPLEGGGMGGGDNAGGALPSPLTCVFLLAAMIFALTLLNPGFDEYLMMSSYGDPATAILFGFVMLIGWRFCEEADNRKSNGLALALLAVILVQIKQSNMFLLAIGAGSLWLFCPRKKELTVPMLLAFLPALAITGLWEFYKAHNLPDKAFSIRSDHWHWELLGALFTAMGKEAIKHNGFTLLLFGLIVLAIRSFFVKPEKLMLLLRAVALSNVGYFGFLVLAYMGSTFSYQEILDAASFMRYMSHVSMAAIAVALLLSAEWVMQKGWHEKPQLRMAGMALVGLVPMIALGLCLLNKIPRPDGAILEQMAFANRIYPKLAADAKIAVLAPHSVSWGMDSFVFNYRLMQLSNRSKHPMIKGRVVQYSVEKTAAQIKTFAEGFDTLILPAGDPLAWQAIGLPPQDHWTALAKKDGQWVMITP